MPRPKKVGASKSKATKKTTKKKTEPVLSEEELEAQRCEELVSTIRTSIKKKEVDEAFNEIAIRLRPRIQKLVNRFNIAGFDSSDIMQEALYALRYKAIKDYNPERGNGIGWAPFDRFAVLCIRRHLSTEYKTSHQNKKKVLNSSISLNQEFIRAGPGEDLSLISIIAADDEPIIDQLEDKEYYMDLMTRLLKSLSSFEKEVFVLYAQRYSYEEIADLINEKRVKVKVNIKGVDNALSRIKQKAKTILYQYEQCNSNDKDDEL